MKYARSVAREIPPPFKRPLIFVWNKIADIHPRRRAYRRWVADTFTPHVMDQRQRLFLIMAQFGHTNRPTGGYYFEFGCNQANTMRMAYDSFRHLFDLQYVAFDSFEGLPEIQDIDRQEIWARGRYKTSEENFRAICLAHGIPGDRLITIKGFYDKSLNDEARRKLQGKRAAFIYIDCDLYHSTIPVLDFCRYFLQVGTVVVFDDWNCFHADPKRGERRAWSEFLAREPHLNFEPLIGNGMQMAFVFTGEK